MFERPFSARYLTDTDKITFAQKRRKIQVQILMDATKSQKDSVTSTFLQSGDRRRARLNVDIFQKFHLR